MELPGKLLEQIAFSTGPKSVELMLVVMGKSTHEAHSAQPLQTKNKQSKTVLTFLTGYKGISNVTDKNYIFNFTKSVDNEHFTKTFIPKCSYEIESLIDFLRNLNETLLMKAILQKKRIFYNQT